MPRYIRGFFDEHSNISEVEIDEYINSQNHIATIILSLTTNA